MEDCPCCGMRLWWAIPKIGRCLSPYCEVAGRAVFVRPCGCYRVRFTDGSGASDYGCVAHSQRLPDGSMPKPDFEDVLASIEIAEIPSDI